MAGINGKPAWMRQPRTRMRGPYCIRPFNQVEVRNLYAYAVVATVVDMSKIAIVVRISDTNDINHKTRAILRLFRLRQIQDATFIELNRSTIKMLKLIEPHIAWGIPNLKTVRLMIFKRGFANINRQRVSLSDNRVIEENLKDFGILCIEDLVHEIYNVGNNFKIVNNFLWPFKLNSPNRNYRKKKHSQFGFADENINKFIQSLI